MTPQERDLIATLLARLQQQANQPKDPEADALIRQGMAAQPDAPYLLVQTVLIQDMALQNAQGRIAELEHQLATKSAPQQPASFLAGASRGSVPSAGAWPRSAPAQAPVWTQSAAGAPAQQPMPGAPQMPPGAGSGFLRQAAATAAGIAGGALLFQGIQSLFGPHYGSGFLAGTPVQPGLSETVVNNYYGDQTAPGTAETDAGETGGDLQSADLADDPGQDDAADQDTADSDVAGDGGNFDV